MKKILIPLVLFSAIIFSSCKKDNPVNSNTSTIRYEFASDKPGNYNPITRIDNVENSTIVNTTMWGTSITVDKNTQHTASITLHAPQEWQGTTTEANATVKIFVDGKEVASNSGVIGGYDRPSGLTASTEVD